MGEGQEKSRVVRVRRGADSDTPRQLSLDQADPSAIVFDPLDGSSNIDAGVNVGTIFGVYRVPDGKEGKVEDVLRPGKEMVAAGYTM